MRKRAYYNWVGAPALQSGKREVAWASAAVFVVSAFIVLLFRTLAPAAAQFDATDYRVYYRPVAQRILSGEGIVDEDGAPATKYPPGYSLLLAVVFRSSLSLGVSEQVGVAILNVIGMATVSLLLFFAAQRLWGLMGGVLVALAWATYPLALALTTWPSPEIPFMVFLFGSLLLLLNFLLGESRRLWLYFLCGCLMGVAMLIRPVAIGIGVLTAVGLLLFNGESRVSFRLVLASALLAGNAAMVLPWEALIYCETGTVIPLSTNGVAAMRDGLTIAVETRGFREGVRVPADVAALMEDVRSLKDQLETPGQVVFYLAEQSRNRPLTVLKLLALKAARSWYATDSQRWEIPILCIQLPYIALSLCASWAAWKRAGPARQFAVGVWLLVFYFWGMNIISTTLVRYSLPVMGLLFLLLPALRAASPDNRRCSGTRRHEIACSHSGSDGIYSPRVNTAGGY